MKQAKTKRSRRKYDAQFKAEALKMIKNRPLAEVARSMGIGENLLYKWRAEEKESLPEQEKAVVEEVEQLRKQLKQLENERDILKKALLIFSRQT
jgi:transposase